MSTAANFHLPLLLPFGVAAKSNAPETFGTLQQALVALRTGIYDGLGFEFGISGSETLRVSEIDLDNDNVVRDNGELEPLAEEIITMIFYTELNTPLLAMVSISYRRSLLNDIGRKRGF